MSIDPSGLSQHMIRARPRGRGAANYARDMLISGKGELRLLYIENAKVKDVI